MPTKITIEQIKQQAKGYKKQNNVKHTEALNKIASLYGFNKFEDLKDKSNKNSGFIENDSIQEAQSLGLDKSQTKITQKIDVSQTNRKELISSLLLINNREDKVVNVVGQNGSGKSVFVGEILDELKKQKTEYLFYDLSKAYSGYQRGDMMQNSELINTFCDELMSKANNPLINWVILDEASAFVRTNSLDKLDKVISSFKRTNTNLIVVSISKLFEIRNDIKIIELNNHTARLFENINTVR